MQHLKPIIKRRFFHRVRLSWVLQGRSHNTLIRSRVSVSFHTCKGADPQIGTNERTSTEAQSSKLLCVYACMPCWKVWIPGPYPKLLSQMQIYLLGLVQKPQMLNGSEWSLLLCVRPGAGKNPANTGQGASRLLASHDVRSTPPWADLQFLPYHLEGSANTNSACTIPPEVLLDPSSKTDHFHLWLFRRYPVRNLHTWQLSLDMSISLYHSVFQTLFSTEGCMFYIKIRIYTYACACV